MKDLKKFIATTIREYLNETSKSIVTYNNDTIIKKFNDKYELENTIKYFPNHPNLFPIIYNINGDEIEIERLDTKKAIKEFNILNNWFKKNLKMSFGSYLMRDYTFKHIYPDRPYPKLPSDFTEEYKHILDKYQKLINDIMKIVGKYFLLDVHSLNFGYDKNGNLKMFDI
jgi:hypothetical protein